MARYVIMRHIDPAPSGGRQPVIALRDEWSILAFILPVIWLLWHRLWFAAFFVLSAIVALGFLTIEPTYQAVILPANLLLNLFVGLEAAGWRIAKARSQGYTVVDVVDAGSREEAELRFAQGAARTERLDETATPPSEPGPYGSPVPDVLFTPPEPARP